MKHCTAGILLIGNELLSGKIADENARFLTRELFALGIEVRRLIVVPDELEEIIEALRDLLGRVDIVFTSGGIGPTHDDITVAAVAQALGRELVIDADLAQRVKEVFGEKLEPAHLKMATVPEGSTLVTAERNRFPTLVVERVYVFAGVPKLLRRSFAAIRDNLPACEARQVVTIFVTSDEWALAPILEETLAAFPEVQIGSYPVLNEPSFRVRLTLESILTDRVDAAASFLLERIPEDNFVRSERS